MMRGLTGESAKKKKKERKKCWLQDTNNQASVETESERL